jgi:hypothetical protein
LSLSGHAALPNPARLDGVAVREAPGTGCPPMGELSVKGAW